MSKNSLYINFLKNNISYKLIALVITLFLWLLVTGRSHQVVSHEMEIRLELPPGLEVDVMEPSSVIVKLKGPPKLVRRFTSRKKDIFFTLNPKNKLSWRLKVSAKKIDPPKGIKVLNISPRFIYLELTKKE